jgi:hypothetical protein
MDERLDGSFIRDGGAASIAATIRCTGNGKRIRDSAACNLKTIKNERLLSFDPGCKFFCETSYAILH